MKTTPSEPRSPGSFPEEHWKLLFATQRSIRYHRRRERSYDRRQKFVALFAALSGSAAIASLLSGKAPPFVTTIVMATAAVANALELVFGFAKSARLHSDIARDWIALEQSLTRTGEHLSADELAELRTRRLDIEARELPVLKNLNVMCHDELVTAYDLPDEYRSNLTGLQRVLAPLMDWRADMVRRKGVTKESGEPPIGAAPKPT